MSVFNQTGIRNGKAVLDRAAVHLLLEEVGLGRSVSEIAVKLGVSKTRVLQIGNSVLREVSYHYTTRCAVHADVVPSQYKLGQGIGSLRTHIGLCLEYAQTHQPLEEATHVMRNLK